MIKLLMMFNLFKKENYQYDIKIEAYPSKRLRGKNRKPLIFITMFNKIFITEQINKNIIKHKPLEILAYVLANDEELAAFIQNKTICINDQYFDAPDIKVDKLKLRGLQLYKSNKKKGGYYL